MGISCKSVGKFGGMLKKIQNEIEKTEKMAKKYGGANKKKANEEEK